MTGSHSTFGDWRLLTLLLLLLTGFAPGARAAQQGNSGGTSSGNVEITYVTGLAARISGLSDFNFGVWNGGDLSANDNLCIGRTGVGFFSSGNYRINASGDGEPGDPAAFTLTNGTDRINYEAYFNDQTGIAGRQQLTAGLTMNNQTGNGIPFIFNYIFGCVAQNANISVVVPAAEIANPAGPYTGTLTLLLIPD